jgi:hypothetical protein
LQYQVFLTRSNDQRFLYLPLKESQLLLSTVFISG